MDPKRLRRELDDLDKEDGKQKRKPLRIVRTGPGWIERICIRVGLIKGDDVAVIGVPMNVEYDEAIAAMEKQAMVERERRRQFRGKEAVQE